MRAALYEYDKLVREGMSKETFEATREFLIKNNNILTQTQGAQLGYALDSRYYNIPDYVSYMREQLTKLTLEDVNAALRKHLKSEGMQVVMITKDAAGLREAIVANKPSPITYNSPKPKEITDEDKVIEVYKISEAEDVVLVPVGSVPISRRRGEEVKGEMKPRQPPSLFPVPSSLFPFPLFPSSFPPFPRPCSSSR